MMEIREGQASIRNFAFASGQVLADLNLSFLTLGAPRRNADGEIANAVLLLHGTSGHKRNWLAASLADELFKPEQPLDTSRYFVVIPDLLGHGKSSKPSDGLRRNFPRYRCGDLVALLHFLVTTGLGIRRLRLVMGISLDGMLSWLLAGRYPDLVEAAVPIGAAPLRMGGRDWIMRRMMIEAVRNDPDWREGNYDAKPTRYLFTAPLLSLMAHGVRQLRTLAPDPRAADAAYRGLIDQLAKHDTNDFLYATEATEDYDPEPVLDAITARVLALNFADDEICPPDPLRVGDLVRRLPQARSVIVPATETSHGHMTFLRAAAWKSFLAELLDDLS